MGATVFKIFTWLKHGGKYMYVCIYLCLFIYMYVNIWGLIVILSVDLFFK